MAKKRNGPRTKKQPKIVYRDADEKKDVEAAIQKIEAHYELGRESLAESPHRAPYGRAVDAEGPKLRLWHARKFAEAYTSDELNLLISRCREQQTALGLSLITRLVTITDKRKRKSLEGQAIRERWSKSTLDLEIRQRFGRRRHLGRNPRRPRDANEALSQIVGLCLRLTRWGEQNTDWNPATGQNSQDDGGVTIHELPPKVLHKLKFALKAVEQLQEVAERALDKSR